jgi:hypothetical protein
VHRGARRRREHVDGLDGLLAGVLEHLGDGDVRDDAHDVDVGRRLAQRQALGLRVTAVDVVNADAAADVDIAFAHGRCRVSAASGRQQ